MKLTTGIDIVHIPRFEKLMEDPQFSKKVFHTSELKNSRSEHLAGIFAAKEAYCKAVGKKLDWLSMEIKNSRSGKPTILCEHTLNADVSISHDHEYAIAHVILSQP